jgi:hypothetical protein
LIVLPGLPVSWGSLRWSRWQVSGCQEYTSIYGQMATDSVKIAHDSHFDAFPVSPEVDSCTWHSLGATVDVDLWRVPAASILSKAILKGKQKCIPGGLGEACTSWSLVQAFCCQMRNMICQLRDLWHMP